MGKDTKIEWATHTFNPWLGCTQVSPACDHCYAKALVSNRMGKPQLWQGERQRTSTANWQQPRRWNRDAAGATERPRVFCASLADVFDNQVPERWRDDLWHLIDQTPNLDWLLLTKRPQNIPKLFPNPATGVKPWGDGWPNVWLGTTAENQQEADRRIPHLLAVPARVRFLSCEPLLGPLDLTPEADNLYQRLSEWYGPEGFDPTGSQPRQTRQRGWFPRIQWVICGGESGSGARPMHPDWARSLRDQCASAGVPFLFKQWGDWAPHRPQAGGDLGGDVRSGRVAIVHPTGQTDVEVSVVTGGRNTIPGSRYMARIGKAKAGRLLDGVQHDGRPA